MPNVAYVGVVSGKHTCHLWSVCNTDISAALPLSMLEDLRDRSSCSSWDDPKAPLAKGGTGKALDLERSAVQDVLRPEGWDLAQSCQMCHEPEPPAESEVTSVLNCESGHGQMLSFLYIMLYAYLCLISFCGRAHLEKH